MTKLNQNRIIVVFIITTIVASLLAALLFFGAAYIVSGVVGYGQNWPYIVAGLASILVGVGVSWAAIYKYKIRGNRWVEMVSGLLEAAFSGWF